MNNNVSDFQPYYHYGNIRLYSAQFQTDLFLNFLTNFRIYLYLDILTIYVISFYDVHVTQIG